MVTSFSSCQYGCVLAGTKTIAQTHQVADRVWPGDGYQALLFEAFIFDLHLTMEHRDIMRNVLKGTIEEIKMTTAPSNPVVSSLPFRIKIRCELYIACFVRHLIA